MIPLASQWCPDQALWLFERHRKFRFQAVELVLVNLLDFTYFSFTVGTSFAASDVEIRARSIRYIVLVHSILSFFYNAAILGIAIGVVTNI
jgi:uncharacterized membrane protein